MNQLENRLGNLGKLRKKIARVEGVDISREDQRGYIARGREKLTYGSKLVSEFTVNEANAEFAPGISPSTERHDPGIMAVTPMMVAPTLNTITFALSNLNIGDIKFDNTAELATKFVNAVEGALEKAAVEITGGYKTDQ